ncbi:MAG: BNR-4 repeat-containing protein [Planctomycetaceae bacterium]|nr:BNR-4 repeat-containing protein [Planctomycetaceae bacterium]
MTHRLTILLAMLMCLPAGEPGLAQPPIRTLSDDGGWCWFEDERAIVHNGQLTIGTVAAGAHDPSRKGNIEATTYDFSTGTSYRSVLHPNLQLDDHDSPAFCVLGDGRVLAMYAKHGTENRMYYRISTKPCDTTQWQPEQVFIPSPKSRVTYSNLFRLADENSGTGRIHNFYRGYESSFKPSWMTSDDDGRSWKSHGVWIDFPNEQRHRPYVKYASNNRDTVHCVFTEGHPRNFDNSLYHAFYRDDAFFRSDGTRIKSVNEGPVIPAEATKIFAGDANNVAWPCDLHLDDQQRPVVVFSVQRDGAGQSRAAAEQEGDHRYRMAQWDGTRWQDHQVAHAGTRLYKGEDDYTGLISIDPGDTNTVYLSSDVDIRNGDPNSSGHYEIYRGHTTDAGKSWTFNAITQDSAVDNLRPIVPQTEDGRTILLWLRGSFTSYTNYDLDVVGMDVDAAPVRDK